jgi:hypothetical protein
VRAELAEAIELRAAPGLVAVPADLRELVVELGDVDEWPGRSIARADSESRSVTAVCWSGRTIGGCL